MKRILYIMAYILTVFSAVYLSQSKASAATGTFKDNENGVLTISYNNKDNSKMKVAITKDNKSYYYDLKNGENKLDIPLTMGNGTYQIRICKNVTGTKYSIIQSNEFELNLENEDDVFLNPNIIVDYKIEDKAITKATNLTKNSKTETTKVEKIYQYVVENYLYDYNKIASLTAGYIPDINIIYKNKKGICYDISSLMAAMLRSQGIRVKVVTGYTPNVDVYHAWNLIYDDDVGKWITVDVTYDLCMYEAGKKYKMIKPEKDYKDIVYQY